MTQPANKSKWFSIRMRTAVAAAALGIAAAASAEVFIYGDIGETWWGDSVTAAEFVKEINALDVTQMTVRINSFGGSVVDGIAIHNAIKRHKASVTTCNDGLAASIASLILMAGDTVEMSDNAMLMIHAPWGGIYGNAVELRRYADMLDTWSEAMAGSYCAKSGMDRKAVLDLLKDGQDHWYTAADALESKFIDSVVDGIPALAMASLAGVDARYKSIPAAWLQASGIQNTGATAPGSVAAPAAAPVAAPAASTVASATHIQETDMKKFGNPSILAAAVLMAAAGAGGEMGAPGGGGSGSPAPGEPTAAQRETILAAERSRVTAITQHAQPFAAYAGMPELLASLTANPAITAEAAGLQILAHVGKDATPVAGQRVVTVEAEADKIRNAGINALLARGGIVGTDGKKIQMEAGNPFRGHTLLDMARDSLVRAGVRVEGMDKMALVAAAFTNSSSDFPILLENTMHKTLQAAYASQPNTWSRWARTGTVSDFRAHKRYRRGSFGNLDVVNEAGEYKTKAVPDGEKAQITATTKGNLVNLTRVAIVNDDLSAFLDIAADLGRAANRTVEADAIAVLVANAALAQDNVTMFHATHNNLGTAALVSETSFDEARTLMAKQTLPGGVDFLDARPAVWLGPIGLMGLANVINESVYSPDSTNKLQRPNMVTGMLKDVVGTPRLTGTAYYLLADKEEVPTVEVAFLDGNQTPYLELQNGFTVDGAQWKVRLDYGVAGVDFRGAVRNAGL